MNFAMLLAAFTGLLVAMDPPLISISESKQERVYFPFYKYPDFDVMTLPPPSGAAPHFWITKEGVQDLLLKSRRLKPIIIIDFAAHMFQHFSFGVDVLNFGQIDGNLNVSFLKFILRPEMLPVIKAIVRILTTPARLPSNSILDTSKADEFTLQLIKENVIPAHWTGSLSDRNEDLAVMEAIKHRKLPPLELSDVLTGKVFTIADTESYVRHVVYSNRVYRITKKKVDALYDFHCQNEVKHLWFLPVSRFGEYFARLLLQKFSFTDTNILKPYAESLTLDHLNDALIAEHHHSRIIKSIIIALKENGADFTDFNFSLLYEASADVRAIFFKHGLISEPTFYLFFHLYKDSEITKMDQDEIIGICDICIKKGADINHCAIQKLALKSKNECLMKKLVAFGLDATGALLSGSLKNISDIWSFCFQNETLSVVFKTLLACEKRHVEDLAAFLFSMLQTMIYCAHESLDGFDRYGFLLDNHVTGNMCQTIAARAALTWRQFRAISAIPVSNTDGTGVLPVEILTILKLKFAIASRLRKL